MKGRGFKMLTAANLRYASHYGFHPDAGADANATALQRAVDNGGTVFVDIPGVYEVSRTIFLSGDTALIFGAGVFIRRAKGQGDRQGPGYAFVNRGAYTRVYDSNIRIAGLRLICNGIEARGVEGGVTGLIGQISFHYIKNLVIEDFECLDLLKRSFCIQVCTFENLVIEQVRIEGDKDGIHLARAVNLYCATACSRPLTIPLH